MTIPMNFVATELLRCPLDQLPLHHQDNCLRCDNAHSFDIARQGYVNLLAASDKRSKNPGDSKAMVAARSDFLDAGHYQPVANKLVELVAPLIHGDSTVVDAGCGEGYYLQQLQAHLHRTGNTTATAIGYDISKWAVQAATRRLAATWLVASNRNIPLAAASADCVLSLFGFPLYAIFCKLIKKEGVVLVVTAGPRHLIELREIIYPSVKNTPSRVAQEAEEAGLSVGQTTSLQYQTKPLCQAQIGQLLTMTPHLFRASHEGKARALALEQMTVTVDVMFQFLHKTPLNKPTDTAPVTTARVHNPAR